MRALETNQFPYPISDFAETFVDLQTQRHDADYNPRAAFT